MTLAITEAAAIAALVPSPSITARWGTLHWRSEKPSTRQVARSSGRQPFKRVGERFDVGHVQAALVDAAGTAHHDADPLGGAQHAGEELGPLLGVHLLGVVQAGEGAAVGVGERLVVDQHRGGDQRAGEAAAAGLVGAGDPAAVEAAVEGEEPTGARQAALVRLALRRGLRGRRCDLGASRWQRPCR